MGLNKDQELVQAAQNGDLQKVVEYAEFWGDPTYDDSKALKQAAMNGHTDVLKFLIPLSNPQADKGFALRVAATRGYTDGVRLLLEFTDLDGYSTNDMNIGTHALYCAAKEECYDIVDLIFDRISNDGVNIVIGHISHLEQSSDYLKYKLEARMQRHILSGEVLGLGVVSQRKI